MNEKRIFGTVLTILGIIALGYFVLQFIKQSKDITTTIVIAVLGLIFLITGIGALKKRQDET